MQETDKVIEQISKALRNYYSSYKYRILKQLIFAKETLIKESFINLAIVKEDEQISKETELLKKLAPSKYRDDNINSFEIIHKPKEPIELKELFESTPDNQFHKHQIIEGKAGIGKTTLCRYIINQWAEDNGSLKNWRNKFSWVIHISLRELIQGQMKQYNKLSLPGLILDILSKCSEEQNIDLDKVRAAYTELNLQGRVLLLLDGYDEISVLYDSNDEFSNFIQTQLLGCDHWILTSRPYYFKAHCDRRLENIGFTSENIPIYIERFFKNSKVHKNEDKLSLPESLIFYLRRNPNAMGIAHIPINLELICCLWQNQRNKIGDNPTFTKLYDDLVNILFNNYLAKKKGSSKVDEFSWEQLKSLPQNFCNKIIDFLENLAFRQMQLSDIIIKENQISSTLKIFYPENSQSKSEFSEAVLKDFGILKGFGEYYSSTLNQEYYFIHLTFQEYFAARYIVSCWKRNENLVIDNANFISIERFIHNEKFNPRYEIVWWMVAGLLKDCNEKLNNFFTILQAEPNDLIGLNSQLLLMRCLEESELKIQEEQKIKILSQLTKWIRFEIINSQGNKINFLTDYLAICPKVFRSEKIQSEFEESLRYDETAINSIKIIAKQGNITQKLSDKLTEILSHDMSSVKQAASQALINQEHLPNEILEKLVSLLSDNDEVVASSAAKVLEAQIDLSDNIIDQLICISDNNSIKDKKFAIEIIGKQKKLSSKNINALIKRLNNQANISDISIANALKHQKNLTKETIEILINKLDKDKNNISILILKILLHQNHISIENVQKLLVFLKENNIDLFKILDFSSDSCYPELIIDELIVLIYENSKEADLASRIIKNQKNLSEHQFEKLNGLLNPDIGDYLYNKFDIIDNKIKFATIALQNKSYLPSVILKSFEKLISTETENEEIKLSVLNALFNQYNLENGMKGNILFLMYSLNEKIIQLASQILYNQTFLPNFIVSKLEDLIFKGSPSQITTKYAIKALQNKCHLNVSTLNNLINFLLFHKQDMFDYDYSVSKVEYYCSLIKILEDQNQLDPELVKNLLSLFHQLYGKQNRSYYFSRSNSIKLIMVKVLAKQECLNADEIKNLEIILGQDEIANDFGKILSIHKLIELILEAGSKNVFETKEEKYIDILYPKCLKQKIPIYIYNNELFVGQKSYNIYGKNTKSNLENIFNKKLGELINLKFNYRPLGCNKNREQVSQLLEAYRKASLARTSSNLTKDNNRQLKRQKTTFSNYEINLNSYENKCLNELESKKMDNESFKFIYVEELFLGDEKTNPSHLEFGTWYHPDICHYLLQLVPNKTKLIRVMFHDADGNNTATFKKQLRELILLSNRLDRPALFIGKEPGAENHFIVGIVKSGQLLFINPLGTTQHSDCYQTFAELLKEKILNALWFSTNLLQQRDYEGERLVSCGAIVLELVTHILSTFTPNIFDAFWEQLKANQFKHHVSSDLSYFESNIQNLLPDSLQEVQAATNSVDYKNKLIMIRKSHCKLLQALTRDLAKGTLVDEFLQKCKDGSPAQVLFNQLIFGAKTITTIDELPEYHLLNIELSTNSFSINAQIGGPAMEDMITSNTNVIRATITLDIGAIKNVIALIDDLALQSKLLQSLEKSVKKATALNNQALNNEVFCQGRDAHIEILKEELKLITESDEYIEFDKTLAVKQILPDLIFPFWGCRPFLKTETEDERTQHIAKEQQLFNEQKAIRTQSTFMQALSQLKEDRKTKQSRKPKLYFMYAWPVQDYAQRESGIQDFLVNLRQDLHHAGIEAIFDREDNFSGNNLHQFMGQILHEHAIVLVFGTESFRHKWFGHKTALQVEGDLLKLKWLIDFSEGNIQSNQKTTIIPLVLTGIRETAIPEDLLPAKNPTVRALCHLSYQQIISSLLAVAYGITEPAVVKYFNDKPDHTITIDPSNHTAPTYYSAIQQQTLFGRVNYPLRNNNNIETQAIASSFTSMEIEEESNTNVPK